MKKIFLLLTAIMMILAFTVVPTRACSPSDTQNINNNTNTTKNTNINANTNANINTNSNKQKQDQAQDQTQSQDQTQGQIQSNSVNNSDSITIIRGREFATSGSVEYGNLLYSAPRFDSYGAWSITEVCLYGNKFRVIDVVISLIEEGMLKEASIYSEDYITVLFGKKPQEGLDRIGYMAVMATKEGSALDALYWIMYRAYLMGGTTVHVVGEGIEKELKSSGWGIGFYGTKATIGNDETSSVVAGGGTGYSRAKAKEEANPWIRAIVLK